MLNDKEAEFYNHRADIELKLKQRDEAIQDYGKAIILDPAESEYVNNRSLAYREVKMYELALNDATNAVQMDLKNAFFLANRGYIYYCLKQYDEAVEDQLNVLDLEGVENDDYYFLSLSLGKRGEFDAAVGFMLTPISFNPEDTEYRFTRAEFAVQAGLPSTDLAYKKRQGEIALEDVNICLESGDFPDERAQLLYVRANAYLCLQQFSKAETDINSALEISPKDKFYLKSRKLIRKMAKISGDK
ncbi:MAG: hypothetical protein COB65_13060 [Thalassobium sp.]|nr:MAG: hypothetical protein COB65_13060 [Thalassobium sp.]